MATITLNMQEIEPHHDTPQVIEHRWQQALDNAISDLTAQLTASLTNARGREAKLQEDLEAHELNRATPGLAGYLIPLIRRQRLGSWELSRQGIKEKLSQVRNEIRQLVEKLRPETIRQAACERVRDQFPDLARKYDQCIQTKRQHETQARKERQRVAEEKRKRRRSQNRGSSHKNDYSR